MAKTYHITTMPSEAHGFTMELFSRAIQNGLIAPGELAVAAESWHALQSAQAVAPATTVPPEEVPSE